MLPKALFFDLDDTIISFDAGSEPAWVTVCDEFCKKYGSYDPEILLGAINEYRKWFWSDKERHRIGRNNMNEARRDIVAGAFERLSFNNREHAFEIADNYSRLRLLNLELFPKAAETLESLRKLELRLALITNGDSYSQRYKIEKFDLEKYFDLILVEGELGFGKPDPRVYEKALCDMGVLPGDVWMIGDNLDWDVASPQKLGIFSIWVDFKHKGLPVGSKVRPDRIISNIAKLLE